MSELLFKYTGEEGTICTVSDASSAEGNISNEYMLYFYAEYSNEKISLKNADENKEIASSNLNLKKDGIYKITVSENKFKISDSDGKELFVYIYNSGEEQNFNFSGQNIYLQEISYDKKGKFKSSVPSDAAESYGENISTPVSSHSVQTSETSKSESNSESEGDGYGVFGFIVPVFLLAILAAVFIIRNKKQKNEHDERKRNEYNNRTTEHERKKSISSSEKSKSHSYKGNNSQSPEMQELQISDNHDNYFETPKKEKISYSSITSLDKNSKSEEPIKEPEIAEKENIIKKALEEKEPEPDIQSPPEEVINEKGLSDSELMNGYYNNKNSGNLTYISYTRNVQTKLAIGSIAINEIEFETTSSQASYFVIDDNRIYINPRFFNAERNTLGNFLSVSKANIFFDVSQSILNGGNVSFIKGCTVRKENNTYVIVSKGLIE